MTTEAIDRPAEAEAVAQVRKAALAWTAGRDRAPLTELVDELTSQGYRLEVASRVLASLFARHDLVLFPDRSVSAVSH